MDFRERVKNLYSEFKDLPIHIMMMKFDKFLYCRGDQQMIDFYKRLSEFLISELQKIDDWTDQGGYSTIHNNPENPVRNDDFLRFIRSKNCCLCGRTGTDAHHYGPDNRDQKPDDYFTVPLCKFCHGKYQSILDYRGGISRDPEIRNIQVHFLDVQRALMAEYLLNPCTPSGRIGVSK